MLNIRTKVIAVAVAVSVLAVVSGCYSGAPVTQVPQTGGVKPKPNTQQGYQQTPPQAPTPVPTPVPEPTPVTEPEPAPEPTATPET